MRDASEARLRSAGSQAQPRGCTGDRALAGDDGAADRRRVTWPADPGQPKRLDPGLYSGAAGVVLFFVELHRTTGDAAALSLVRRGADDLATRVPEDPAPHLFGLYPGNEGIAFALFEAYGVTGDERHRQAALRILGLVHDKARATDGEGVAWNDSYDVMSGIAGTGLFLLWAARALGRPDSVALAARAGAALLALGRPEGDGLKWQLGAESSRLMPNFSHGTAGVSYFLASLYLETRQARFLEGALAGARYLQRVEHDGLVFHYEPGGEDRYYLAWCHGPCGTGRLYHRLWQITGEPRWREAVARGGRALLASGIPERRTSGFWNNIGQCCGSAGVAEYALNLAYFLNDDGYRRLTERMTADLLARGTRDGTGLRFVQAEQSDPAHTPGRADGVDAGGGWCGVVASPPRCRDQRPPDQRGAARLPIPCRTRRARIQPVEGASPRASVAPLLGYRAHYA